MYVNMVAPKNGHFSLAKKMERIIIQNQRLEELPAKVFEGANNVAVVQLDNNVINSLDEDTFINLRKLEFLSISSNDIRSLPEKMFNTLESLQTLDMGSNMITALPKTLFSNNRRLEYIRFSHNRIMMIPNLNVAERSFYDFSNNFCIDRVILSTSELNEVTREKCIIDKEPLEIVTEFKRQNEIDNICKDKSTLLTFQSQLEEIMETKTQLVLENENLKNEITKIKMYKNSMC